MPPRGTGGEDLFANLSFRARETTTFATNGHIVKSEVGGSSTQIIVWNLPPTADFAKCPLLSKIVVSRRRNDRFAKWYSWPVPLAGILFSKLVDLRGKVDGFCAEGLR